MKIAGLGILDDFARKHADVRQALEAWVAEVNAAQWSKPEDIKARYHSASFLGEKRVIFNLKGKKYRLDVKIAYQTGVVVIIRIGTHAEYNKWTFD